VNTVLGSSAPPLTVKLVQAFISGSKDSSVIESLVSNDLFFFLAFCCVKFMLLPTFCLF
jgi:hypothetical protein